MFPNCNRQEFTFSLLFSAVVPSAATIIIVVCVGFLALMVILGVLRIHSLHRRGAGHEGTGSSAGSQGSARAKESEMFWDDSALTIIVNPMEVSGGRCLGKEDSMEGNRWRVQVCSPYRFSPQSYQSCQERAAEGAECKAREAAEEEEEDSSDSESPDTPGSDAANGQRIVGKHEAPCRY